MRRRTPARRSSVSEHFPVARPGSHAREVLPASLAKRPEAIGKNSRDRRVGRTRALLHEALFRLLGDRDYHRISVTEILESANVGRSTFYTHFPDKDALFASAVQEMLESVRPGGKAGAGAGAGAERIIGFSLPLLEHIQRHRGAAGAHMGERGRAALHAHFRRVLADWISEEVGGAKAAARAAAAGRLAPDLLARFVASTFVLVLDWWVERKCALSPAEADRLFRSLALPAMRL